MTDDLDSDEYLDVVYEDVEYEVRDEGEEGADGRRAATDTGILYDHTVAVVNYPGGAKGASCKGNRVQREKSGLGKWRDARPYNANASGSVSRTPSAAVGSKGRRHRRAVATRRRAKNSWRLPRPRRPPQPPAQPRGGARGRHWDRSGQRPRQGRVLVEVLVLEGQRACVPLL